MKRLAVLLVIVFGWLGPTAAAGQTEDAAALFARANGVYAEADALAVEDPAGARALYLQSSALYGELVEQRGIENFMLHVNRGNALLRAGDVGRAVASYRRAERLRPSDERVRAGLTAARAMTATEVKPNAAQRAADALLWWRGFAPRGALLGIGIGAYLLVWALATARLARRSPGLTRGVVASAAAALVCLGSLALEEALVFHARSVVVIADEVVGRNGPDAGAYEATFTAPIHAGVEATILETRNGWLRVRLADGRSTWLPAESVEVV